MNEFVSPTETVGHPASDLNEPAHSMHTSSTYLYCTPVLNTSFYTILRSQSQSHDARKVARQQIARTVRIRWHGSMWTRRQFRIYLLPFAVLYLENVVLFVGSSSRLERMTRWIISRASVATVDWALAR